jgi:hypothetical protein
MTDTIIPNLTDPKLYGRKELAEALGVKPWFIRRMIFVGFKMPLGVASVAMAHKFLSDNADILAVANKKRGGRTRVERTARGAA